MGNPHCVIFVDNVEIFPVREIGPLIENHPFFPKRVNVEFAEVKSRSHVKARVWERGAGETLACGTGACAAVVAGCLQGLIDDTVTVNLRGGKLRISWAGGESPVMMTGPTTTVYEGIFRL
jgi:diaminopimelate epimerase